MADIIESALRDLRALEAGGIGAAMVENHNGDPRAILLNKANVSSFAIVAKKVVEAATYR